jgi:hypothetical protein
VRRTLFARGDAHRALTLSAGVGHLGVVVC